MPRLPGPPYHFVTRVTHVAGERLSMRPGAEATMEYDVPVDAWYFDENGNRSMPWCVLLEAALQPCGWLSVYVGCPIVASENVFFRNLDGAGKMTGEVFGGSTVRTHTKVTSVSNVSGIILVSYKIECHVGDRAGLQPDRGVRVLPDAWRSTPRSACKTTPEQRTALDRRVAGPVRSDRAPGEVLRRAAPAPRPDAPHDRPRHRATGAARAPRARDASAWRRPSSRTTGTSARTSTATRCSPGRSASSRCCRRCSFT